MSTSERAGKALKGKTERRRSRDPSSVEGVRVGSTSATSSEIVENCNLNAAWLVGVGVFVGGVGGCVVGCGGFGLVGTRRGRQDPGYKEKKGALVMEVYFSTTEGNAVSAQGGRVVDSC